MKTLTRDDIEQMTEVEKLELIFELEKSLHTGGDGLTEVQKAELDRRLETFEEDLADAVDWEDFKAELDQSDA